MIVEWFAIWTRSRHEKMVRDQLTQKDVDVFLPTITRWSRWKDRKKKIDWPLFPGYCFARFDASERLAILKCEGVVTIVGTDGADTKAGGCMEGAAVTEEALGPHPAAHQSDQL